MRPVQHLYYVIIEYARYIYKIIPSDGCKRETLRGRFWCNTYPIIGDANFVGISVIKL